MDQYLFARLLDLTRAAKDIYEETHDVSTKEIVLEAFHRLRSAARQVAEALVKDIW